MVQPPPHFTDTLQMQNNMSCVDLCASAFIEIPDTCVMYVYTLKKYIDQHIIQILFNVLKMIEFSLVIHHVFGGSVVVEKIQNTAPFSCLQTYQTTPKGPVTPPPRNEEREMRNEERGTRNEKRETRNEKRGTRNEKRETAP